MPCYVADTSLFAEENFLLQSEEEEGSLGVDYFTFSSTIADHLRSASLVISHAGMLFTNFLFTNYFAIIDSTVVTSADIDDLYKETWKTRCNAPCCSRIILVYKQTI